MSEKNGEPTFETRERTTWIEVLFPAVEGMRGDVYPYAIEPVVIMAQQCTPGEVTRASET